MDKIRAKWLEGFLKNQNRLQFLKSMNYKPYNHKVFHELIIEIRYNNNNQYIIFKIRA